MKRLKKTHSNRWGDLRHAGEFIIRQDEVCEPLTHDLRQVLQGVERHGALVVVSFRLESGSKLLGSVLKNFLLFRKWKSRFTHVDLGKVDPFEELTVCDQERDIIHVKALPTS